MMGEVYFAIGFIVAIISLSCFDKNESKRELLQRIVAALVITVAWPLFVLMILVFRNDY